MKTNKLLPDLSIKKIWDRLTKHDSDVNTLQENINELDTDLQNQIDELNSKLNGYEINYTEHIIQVTENQYVSPFTYYGVIDIQSSMAAYGFPISATAIGKAGAPMPCSLEVCADGRRMINVSSNAAEVTIRVMWLKLG